MKLTTFMNLSVKWLLLAPGIVTCKRMLAAEDTSEDDWVYSSCKQHHFLPETTGVYSFDLKINPLQTHFPSSDQVFQGACLSSQHREYKSSRYSITFQHKHDAQAKVSISLFKPAKWCIKKNKILSFFTNAESQQKCIVQAYLTNWNDSSEDGLLVWADSSSSFCVNSSALDLLVEKAVSYQGLSCEAEEALSVSSAYDPKSSPTLSWIKEKFLILSPSTRPYFDWRPNSYECAVQNCIFKDIVLKVLYKVEEDDLVIFQLTIRDVPDLDKPNPSEVLFQEFQNTSLKAFAATEEWAKLGERNVTDMIVTDWPYQDLSDIAQYLAGLSSGRYPSQPSVGSVCSIQSNGTCLGRPSPKEGPPTEEEEEEEVPLTAVGLMGALLFALLNLAASAVAMYLIAWCINYCFCWSYAAEIVRDEHGNDTGLRRPVKEYRWHLCPRPLRGNC